MNIPTMLADYFYIKLGQDIRFALPVAQVQGVLTLHPREICPLPGMNPAVLGVANQRGKLLWILDLANFLSQLLELAPLQTLTEKENFTVVVVSDPGNLPANAWQLGCAIASTHGIVPLNSAEFKPFPAQLTGVLGKCCSALADIDRVPVAILNLGAVFTALQHLAAKF